MGRGKPCIPRRDRMRSSLNGAYRWLRQLLCIHAPKQQWHIQQNAHYASDICTRCGKVTMKYFLA